MTSIDMQFTRTRISSSVGSITLPGNHNEIMVCQYLHMTNSMGCSWFGCDPFAFTMPVLMSQLIVIFCATATTYFILKPFQQCLLSAQLIAGIVLAPILTHYQKFTIKLFPPGGRFILKTIADLAFSLHLFIIGVQIDTSLFTRMGRSSVVIGFMSFLVPYLLVEFMAFFLPQFVTVDELVRVTLPFVGAIGSMTTFPAITCVLTDLNMLNSELGRLATKAAMVADLCNYITSLMMSTIGVSLKLSQWTPMNNIVWFAVFVLVILYVLRPFVLRIAKQLENKEMRESHFVLILVLVLICGFFSECLGQNAALGAFMMGVGVPDGPPLGTSLVQKLDVFNTGLLLPAKFVISGLLVDLNSLGGENFGSSIVILVVVATGCITKFFTILALAFHYVESFWDAISLSLIMSCKGVLDIAGYTLTYNNEVITDQEYAMLVLNKLIVTGIARFLIWHFYDPATRYMGLMRNSILQPRNPGSVLRILICIHNEHDIPSTLNLIETSTATKARPITVSTLNLLELAGRSASILVPNFIRDKRSYSGLTRASQIVNAFSQLAERNRGGVMVEHFTSIAPYSTMHEDICTMALDKMVNIIIVPFHKYATIDGKLDRSSSSGAVRAVNLKVIQRAPCSVGILVDRGRMRGKPVLNLTSKFRLMQLFLGGPDDREALAYCTRVIDNPCISFTLIWLRPQDHGIGSFREVYEYERNMDRDMIRRFQISMMDKKGVVFREEILKDVVETTRLLRSISEEDKCDLLVVGRDHEAQYQLIEGLLEWCECPELGVVGDMLVTSESRFSVLVVQQQPPRPGGLDSIGKCLEVGSGRIVM